MRLSYIKLEFCIVLMVVGDFNLGIGVVDIIFDVDNDLVVLDYDNVYIRFNGSYDFDLFVGGM